MKNKIENIIYSYNPKEFMPIYVDGNWSNRSAFLAYKARTAGRILTAKLSKV